MSIPVNKPKRDKRMALQFDPKVAVTRTDLLNNLAGAARVVYGDPQVAFLDIKVMDGKKERVFTIKVLDK